MSAPPLNRNARKPRAHRHSIKFSVRATPDQAARWRRAAGQMGVSMWLRMIAEARWE